MCIVLNGEMEWRVVPVVKNLRFINLNYYICINNTVITDVKLSHYITLLSIVFVLHLY